MMLMAVVDMDQELDHSVIKLCGTIHDAIVGRVRIDRMDQISVIKKCLEHPSLLDTFGIDLSVPITTDITIGDWGMGEDPTPASRAQIRNMAKRGFEYHDDIHMFCDENKDWSFYNEGGKLVHVGALQGEDPIAA
jgi:hypothetical protein